MEGLDIIEELQKELDILETERKYRLKQGKRKKILETNLRRLQLIYPFMLAGIFSTLITYILFGNIFKSTKNQVLNIKKTFDSDGNISTQQQYYSFDSESMIKFYKTWYYVNNEYRREVDIYYLNDEINEEKLKNIIYSENYNFADLFKKENTIIERKEALSEEELKNNKEYVEGILYDKDENKIIQIKAPRNRSILTILLNILCQSVAFSSRVGSYNKYKIHIKEYEEEYDELEKEMKLVDFILEIKKDNIRTLTRKIK